MQLTIEGPSSIEAADIQVLNNAITARPLAIKGNRLIRVCYIIATGDGGMETRAGVFFNTNTGDFTIKKIDLNKSDFMFDNNEDTFKDQRKKAKENRTARFGKSTLDIKGSDA